MPASPGACDCRAEESAMPPGFPHAMNDDTTITNTKMALQRVMCITGLPPGQEMRPRRGPGALLGRGMIRDFHFGRPGSAPFIHRSPPRGPDLFVAHSSGSRNRPRGPHRKRTDRSAPVSGHPSDTSPPLLPCRRQPPSLSGRSIGAEGDNRSTRGRRISACPYQKARTWRFLEVLVAVA